MDIEPTNNANCDKREHLTDFPDVVTPKEAAEVLRLSERAVQHLLRTKRLPGVKIGGSWRIERQLLLDLMKSANFEATA